MTGRIGRITADPETRRAKNGDSNVTMLTVRFSDGGTASVQWMPGAGEDTVPQKNDIVAVERYGGVLIANASMSPGDPERKPGERHFYSRNPGGSADSEILLTDKVYIGNKITNMCELLLGIIDEIENLVTAGAPPSHTVSPASVVKLEAYKERIKALNAKEK